VIGSENYLINITTQRYSARYIDRHKGISEKYRGAGGVVGNRPGKRRGPVRTGKIRHCPTVYKNRVCAFKRQ
jgi:hypothetical protein